MDKKFDELTQRLQEIDCKVSETTELAKDNKRQIDYLVQERDSLSMKNRTEEYHSWNKLSIR